MSVEQNKEILRRVLTEVISKGDLALADELIATDFIAHHRRPGQGEGLEGFKQGLAMIRAAFPDWQSAPDAMLGEGNLVSARWTVQGTHQGPFMGVPPTGKHVTMKEIGIFLFAGGKLVEFWGLADELSLLQQLGLLPPMGQPPPPSGEAMERAR